MARGPLCWPHREVSAASLAAGLLVLAVLAQACSGKEAHSPQAGIPPQQVADMLHAVVAADREVYAKAVVNRLTEEQRVQIYDGHKQAPAPLQASEDWKSEFGTLPLPAQMLRMSAEEVTRKQLGFSYVLLSQWPVNEQNHAKTDAERNGLQAVVENRGKQPFYGEETLGGQRYFAAVYPDVAVAEACVNCHNRHPDSPRRDFRVGDVMGGVVIRIPLAN